MVTYDFYVDKYHGGSVSEDNWPALERDACAKLRQYKNSFTVTAPEETSEAMAVCAMAEVLDAYELARSGVQSASIGSVSVSYASAVPDTDFSMKSQERALYRAACMYLDIYRG